MDDWDAAILAAMSWEAMSLPTEVEQEQFKSCSCGRMHDPNDCWAL